MWAVIVMSGVLFGAGHLPSYRRIAALCLGRQGHDAAAIGDLGRALTYLQQALSEAVALGGPFEIL